MDRQGRTAGAGAENIDKCYDRILTNGQNSKKAAAQKVV
jgi:hypothetical protein